MKITRITAMIASFSDIVMALKGHVAGERDLDVVEGVHSFGSPLSYH